MCLASTEYGGPKRCASHASAKYGRASDLYSIAEEKMVAAKVFQFTLSELRPSFWTQKNKLDDEAMAAIINLFPDTEKAEEIKEIYDKSFLEAIRKRKEFKEEMALNEDDEEYDSFIRGDTFQDRENRKIQLDRKYNAITPFSVMVETHPELININSYQEEWFKAKQELNEAENEYWGTEEGLGREVLSEDNWNDGKPNEKVRDAVNAFTKQSHIRESQRRNQMETVRLNAKARATPEGWAEYQKWQNAWDRDPTLIGTNTYKLVNKNENDFQMQCERWVLQFERNPETGKITRKKLVN